MHYVSTFSTINELINKLCPQQKVFTELFQSAINSITQFVDLAFLPPLGSFFPVFRSLSGKSLLFALCYCFSAFSAATVAS